METERAHTCVSHGTCPISKMYASLSVLGTMARGTEMLCCSSLLPSILQQQRLLRCYACCMLGISPPLVDDVVTIAVRQQCTSSLPARHVALVPSHVIIPIAQKTLFDGKDPASVLQCVFPCTQNVRIPFVPFLFVIRCSPPDNGDVSLDTLGPLQNLEPPGEFREKVSDCSKSSGSYRIIHVVVDCHCQHLTMISLKRLRYGRDGMESLLDPLQVRGIRRGPMPRIAGIIDVHSLSLLLPHLLFPFLHRLRTEPRSILHLCCCNSRVPLKFLCNDSSSILFHVAAVYPAKWPFGRECRARRPFSAPYARKIEKVRIVDKKTRRLVHSDGMPVVEEDQMSVALPNPLVLRNLNLKRNLSEDKAVLPYHSQQMRQKLEGAPHVLQYMGSEYSIKGGVGVTFATKLVARHYPVTGSNGVRESPCLQNTKQSLIVLVTREANRSSRKFSKDAAQRHAPASSTP
mmetsp:Transcript_38962/g.123927  ORF Transcript_38962/g.123927 Transcript_38962/m.123927 type:complete len:460 (+) Transcript_38962:1517-2896(+)